MSGSVANAEAHSFINHHRSKTVETGKIEADIRKLRIPTNQKVQTRAWALMKEWRS